MAAVLLTMSVDALSSMPKLIDLHGEGEICLISLDDLLEVLADPPPALAEVMTSARQCPTIRAAGGWLLFVRDLHRSNTAGKTSIDDIVKFVEHP
ncbi:hypothetical protein ELH67_08530 [Rhizobium ruizarguesonis]|nr:hypothetical protein ELH67_08530 [Rhizobium ruizarguesonis]